MKSKARPAQPVLNYHKIGETVRKYRNEKQLKLVDLARKTNISSAMLSKIENGRLIPTIPTLFIIIQQLSIPLDLFFSALNTGNAFEGYLFIPRSKYTGYVKEEKATGFHYFSILEQRMEAESFQVSLLNLDPGSKRKMVTTEAFEYLYVLSGPVTYHLGKDVFKLSTGDSLFFDGSIAHLPENETKKTVSMLVVFFFKETGI